MKIAVITEVSTAHRNQDVVSALSGRGHEILNVGMKGNETTQELTYIHTGLLAGILLNSGTVDLVVGGCGTGQGFLISAMQYPGVFCGLIRSPLDAWLFAQINGGNCISLQLNKEYGWGADVELGFVFDRMFSVEIGCGYPEHRKESQAGSRSDLAGVSKLAHRSIEEILLSVPHRILNQAVDFPGVMDLLDESIKTTIRSRESD